MLNFGVVCLIAWFTAAEFGCTYRRVIRDDWAGLREYADKSPQPAVDPADRGQSSGVEGWAIRMASIDGDDALEQAKSAIAYLQKHGNVPDLWYRRRGKAVEVYRGRYLAPTNPVAQSDLRQTRMLVIDGKRPYQQVELVPLTASAEAERPMKPADLRTQSGMYTLQVAYFDDSFGPKFRDAAEQAVQALREQGFEAFYYHGPNRSLVTTGLFSYEQAFVRGPSGQDQYSPQVLALQEQFPCNLGNGITLEQEQAAKRAGQPGSFLVLAP